MANGNHTLSQYEYEDGYSAQMLFNKGFSYTYDDIILLPGFINFAADEVDLSTKITKNIKLAVPLVSSPMDTVTEVEMSIAMATVGGIGIIHSNNSIEKQVSAIKKVKNHKIGYVVNPVVMSPNNTLSDLDQLKKLYGLNNVCITDNGSIGGKFLGIITSRDKDLIMSNKQMKLKEIMIKDVHIAPEGTTYEQALSILKEKRISRLPVVNENNELVGLIIRTMLEELKCHIVANKVSLDSNECLMVGAAIGTREMDKERVAELYKAGADVIVIDSSQGNSIFQLEMLKYIKSHFKDLNVICGNVVTKSQAKNLIESGADGIRVGMGSGSICTTQEVCAVGRGQASAVYHVSSICKNYDIPIIADGGVQNSGHIIKALTLGACAVMCGSIFAGTNESPGEYQIEDGHRVKVYRGMGSLEAMVNGSDVRYMADNQFVKVAQGVSGKVLDKGSVYKLIPYLSQAIKHGFQDLGVKTIKMLHDKMNESKVRMECRTSAAQAEGTVHHLYSVSESMSQMFVCEN